MGTKDMIFVFGSNEGGIHGAGAALYAHKIKGAVWGKGVGLYNMSYAIPTKDASIKNTLSLTSIQKYVDQFIGFANIRKDLKFQVTCIGCGLAGHWHEDIAPMFQKAPDNCFFDYLWQPYLTDKHYWGSF